MFYTVFWLWSLPLSSVTYTVPWISSPFNFRARFAKLTKLIYGARYDGQEEPGVRDQCLWFDSSATVVVLKCDQRKIQETRSSRLTQLKVAGRCFYSLRLFQNVQQVFFFVFTTVSYLLFKNIEDSRIIALRRHIFKDWRNVNVFEHLDDAYEGNRHMKAACCGVWRQQGRR